MLNMVDPARMTPSERLDEVAMLMARAMMRLFAKLRSSGSQQRTISRDFLPVGAGSP